MNRAAIARHLNNLWQGDGRFWPHLWRMFWVIVRLIVIRSLLNLAISFAHWKDPARLLSAIVLIASASLLVWAFRDLGKVIRDLGLKRSIATILLLVVSIVAFRIWVKPDDQPIHQRITAEFLEMGLLIRDESISWIRAVVQIGPEFLSAYQGGSRVTRLPPGFPTPDPEATPIQAIVVANNSVDNIQAQRTPSPPELSEAKPLTIGNNALVANTDGAPLRVRAAPGLEQPILWLFPEKSQLRVVDGPERADRLFWWKVHSNFGEGWCSDQWLESVE